MEALHRKVLEKRETILGPDHPDTLGTRHNLALCVAVQERHNEAKVLLRRVLEGRQSVLGPDHPDTQSTKDWLRNLEDGGDSPASDGPGQPSANS